GDRRARRAQLRRDRPVDVAAGPLPVARDRPPGQAASAVPPVRRHHRGRRGRQDV
ncbi:MAG: hypothetical protein AVDCRST_MAG20-774, partial [uncultured Acidimicrobiales bacterium]